MGNVTSSPSSLAGSSVGIPAHSRAVAEEDDPAAAWEAAGGHDTTSSFGQGPRNADPAQAHTEGPTAARTTTSVSCPLINPRLCADFKVSAGHAPRTAHIVGHPLMR